MVAFFRYSPIDILSVHLPPSMLEFCGDVQQEWIRKEAAEVCYLFPLVLIPVKLPYSGVADYSVSFFR